MPTRTSGNVYGDLSGSIFEPQVKSITNINSGTLGYARGGTGLTSAGPSGSVLASNASSLIYKSGFNNTVQLSSSINSLTSSISSSFIQKSGGTFTGPVTASAGVSSSFYVLSNGTRLSSSGQFGILTSSNIPSIGDLLIYQENAWFASKILTGSYTISGTLKLDPQSALPAGSLGKMAVSGSNSYFHDGTSWRLINLT